MSYWWSMGNVLIENSSNANGNRREGGGDKQEKAKVKIIWFSMISLTGQGGKPMIRQVLQKAPIQEWKIAKIT